MRVVILPGNGCGNVRSSNWYGWLENTLKKNEATSFEVTLENMPDPNRARRSIWIPFIKSDLLKLSKDQNNAPDAIIVGHSSGAEAAMRLAEDVQVGGLVLVAACHTDLGEPSEAAAGWYPPSGGSWKWDQIKANSKSNIILLHSHDDPFIPINEARFVARNLNLSNDNLREFVNESHFFRPSQHILKAVNDVARNILTDNNETATTTSLN